MENLNFNMEQTKKRGGHRPGSGRPTNNRKVMLGVRLSQEAADKLNQLTKNKAAYIEKLIMEQPFNSPD